MSKDLGQDPTCWEGFMEEVRFQLDLARWVGARFTEKRRKSL